jgi:hypothetical protein
MFGTLIESLIASAGIVIGANSVRWGSIMSDAAQAERPARQASNGSESL